tara:strand:+ start:26 stop:379 length:354 start_codon:yes stop_codon:yes gene_type:complete
MQFIKLNKLKYNEFILNLQNKNIYYYPEELVSKIADIYDIKENDIKLLDFISIILDDMKTTNCDLFKKILEFCVVMISYITIKDYNKYYELSNKLKKDSYIVWNEIKSFNNLNLEEP